MDNTQPVARKKEADLAARADAAATELRALADDITRAIDTLPKWASAGTRELLEQQARRALAISAALRVEARSPDEGVVGHLLNARTAVIVAAVAILSTTGVGAGEEAGADAWRAVRTRIEQVPGKEGEEAEDTDPVVKPRVGGWNTAHPFGFWLRRIRAEHGLTQREVAELLGVSQQAVASWETNKTAPRESMSGQIISGFRHQVSAEEFEELLDLLRHDG